MDTYYVEYAGKGWRTFLDCGNAGLTGEQRHIKPMETEERPDYWHESLTVVLATIVRHNNRPMTLVIR